MKKYCILILMFFYIFLLLNNCGAQWIQQYSGTTMDLLKVRFINRNTGYICASGGILKTTNGGNNWIILNIPVSKPLRAVFPVDSNVVYSTGLFETIIKSTNGGVNWIIIRDGPYGTGGSFLSCFFINPDTGWISGVDNKIYLFKTTNGFLTYDSIPYCRQRS